jgi:hypothetical protein
LDKGLAIRLPETTDAPVFHSAFWHFMDETIVPFMAPVMRPVGDFVIKVADRWPLSTVGPVLQTIAVLIYCGVGILVYRYLKGAPKASGASAVDRTTRD